MTRSRSRCAPLNCRLSGSRRSEQPSFVAEWRMSEPCLVAGDRVAGTGDFASDSAVARELADLLIAMRAQRTHGDFSSLIPVDRFSKLGQITEEYNRVLLRVAAEIQAREEAVEAAQRAAEKFRGIFENSVEGIFQT